MARESGTETVLWTWAVTPAEGDPTEPSDIALRPPEAAVIVARCCEPTSGHVHSVPLDGSEEAAQVDQGYRFDLAGSVFARVDAFTGMLGIKPAFPGFTGQWIQEAAGAFDVAVGHDGSAVVTLSVPEIDSNGVGTGSAVVVYTTEPGEPAESHRWPVPGRRYCGVVALDHGLVGLMVGEPDQGDSGLWACLHREHPGPVRLLHRGVQRRRRPWHIGATCEHRRHRRADHRHHRRWVGDLVRTRREAGRWLTPGSWWPTGRNQVSIKGLTQARPWAPHSPRREDGRCRARYAGRVEQPRSTAGA